MSSVTVDMKDFSSQDFNAKSWINSVLKPTTITNDDGAKDFTMLVTKLQIISETTSRQFDQLSTQVLKSMPRILYDLKVIADNATLTHQGVEAVKKNLGLIEGVAALQRLRRPHVAKTRMEECRVLLLYKANALEEQRKALDALMKTEQERQEEEAVEKNIPVEEEPEPEESEQELEQVEPLKIFDEGLEYGHVQLPPLRSTPLPPRVQQIPQPQPVEDGYLQQMTPQVSNVFKRIGVPLDKFWQ